MWPDLFGPGWVWGVLLSSGLLGSLIVLLKMLQRSTGVQEGTDDPLQVIWRRYEQGDLTQWEFERLRRQSVQMSSHKGHTRRLVAGLCARSG